MSTYQTNNDLFKEFTMIPKNPMMEIVKGDHYFINNNNVTRGKQETMESGEIKDYIYNRIKKPMTKLVLYSICILQEIGTLGLMELDLCNP